MRAMLTRGAIFAALLFPATGLAGSIKSLVGQADAVVVGVGSQAVKTGRIATFNLAAERVVKGSIEPDAVLRLVWDSGTDQAQWKEPPTLRGIWFLKAVPGGWDVIPAKPSTHMLLQDLTYRTAPSQTTSRPASGEGDSIWDQLILEFAASTLERPSVILAAADGADSPSIIRMFRGMVASQSVDAKITGLAGLLERGDEAAILQLEEESGSLRSSRTFGLVAGTVGFAFRNTAPGSVNALGRMATGTQQAPALRLAAARALSAVHTREALPYLASLLDDPDPVYVSFGVVGLSFFANGVGVQTVAGMPGLDHLNKRQPVSYRTSETERYLGFDTSRQQEFVDFWKRWWADRRVKLEQR